jgi:hypothetical protein
VIHFCERYVREELEGKKVPARPRTKLQDWMIRETDSRTFEDLKNSRWTEKDGERGISDLSKDIKLKKNELADCVINHQYNQF